jgi:large subunit ribosomal protein L9
MQIILLERIGRLGQMGDVVKVKDGYARNFLLPKGKALRATKANLAQFETQRTQLEANNLELKKEADTVAVKLNGKSFIALRQASDSGQLYGSVSTRDIAELITEGGFTVARSQILLDRPIKALGRHSVRVGLHPEVIASVTVNVARTLEEAERQARGENINVMRDDDDEIDAEAARAAAEELFDEEADVAESEEV